MGQERLSGDAHAELAWKASHNDLKFCWVVSAKAFEFCDSVVCLIPLSFYLHLNLLVYLFAFADISPSLIENRTGLLYLRAPNSQWASLCTYDSTCLRTSVAFTHFLQTQRQDMLHQLWYKPLIIKYMRIIWRAGLLQKNINYRKPRHHSESELTVCQFSMKQITNLLQPHFKSTERSSFFITLKISSSKKSSQLFET